MSECGLLSERIPAVALGRAGWTAQERQHLDDCPACKQEWEIVRGAGLLGQDVEERLDLHAITVSLRQRLQSDRQVERLRRRTLTVGSLAAAAGIVNALWTGSPSAPSDSGPMTGALAAGRLAIPLPELQSLEPAELDSLLQTMDDPNAVRAAMEDPDLGDLSSEELESVLDSWEG
jgi:hypothetical protein